ncbi:MAG: bifunctional hydroxymethylpyrimidine kinase/phosphomethylpyrimidine kinase [Deltaproteobacteria bacterium]|jgi:hydroxymethylpyrimidine/phosphomethylpyrimidine kinase|nr:bifunctional hydroxymethylpyrimidine kinase/phosphomethylpyrimidine kinase [Deltaproteobacteria bacterium]
MLHPPNILTIAGSDSGGGAGIQADVKTIAALGGYGMSVITALTAQNGLGVAGIHDPGADFVARQLTTVLDGFPVAAAKSGMLFSAQTITCVAQLLRARSFPLVVDPVSVSRSGAPLLREDAVDALRTHMLPLADLLTPNGPEAAMLSGMAVDDADGIAAAGKRILDMGPKAVLIKGGHFESLVTVTDWLFVPGEEPAPLRHARVESVNTHGTGCTLSAAIATGLGRGLPLRVAVTNAQEYLNLALRRSYNPGKGVGPLNHMAKCLP